MRFLSFRVLSINVRGIQNEKKRRKVFDFYRKRADIILLQETHSEVQSEAMWANEWGGKIICSHGDSNARGVMILVSRNFPGKVFNSRSDGEGRWLLVDVELNEVKISIMNVYAPNKDSPCFFQKIEKVISEAENNFIIMGDFNLTLDEKLDRFQTSHNNEKAKKYLLSVIADLMLTDVWRMRHEDTKEYSWFKKNNLTAEIDKASRIDLCLATPGVVQIMHDTYFVNSEDTDHRALMIILDVKSRDRGAGYWKLNSSFIFDTEYIKIMTDSLNKDIESLNDKDPAEKWETLKKRIQKTTQRFARMKSSENNTVISNLNEIITDLESRLPLLKREYELLEESKKDLTDLLNERTNSIIFRSKAKWYADGDRSSKYFFNLEKNRYNNRTCFQIFNKNREVVTEIEEILQIQKQFYTDLYAQNPEVECTINELDVKINENCTENKEVQIQINELDIAIKQMAKNKSPGPDGITVEFYQKFWDQLRQPLYQAFLYSYDNKILHSTAREGVLNLIPKANKDTRDVKNLRPITLLNVDYKILEKVLANRMLPILQEIIHSDQRGFLPDRRISVNIRKMLDAIERTQKEDIEGVIISCDFQKAFDRISHDSLFKALKMFKFSEVLQEWTKIIYTEFEVKVQNNGYFSDKIQIEQGLHQGGALLKSLLFNNSRDTSHTTEKR